METSKKYLLKIAYEGSGFAGWQTQSNGIGIQALIESKLSILLKHPVAIVGSGRTDSGVHALAQMAHFETSLDLNLSKTLHSLNALLPLSIRILSIESVDSTFHARFHAKQKTYRYFIYNHPIHDPFLMSTSWHIPYPLSIPKIKEALRLLEGERDFKAFAAKNETGAAAVCSKRHLKSFTVVEERALLIFELTANGFLYKMVRNLIGCVVEIGAGKRSLETLLQALEEGSRSLVGATAPPHGLFLTQVEYSN